MIITKPLQMNQISALNNLSGVDMSLNEINQRNWEHLNYLVLQFDFILSLFTSKNVSSKIIF